MRNRLLALAALGAALSLGACASVGGQVRDAINRVTADDPRDRTQAAMDMLQRGDERRAKSELEAVLREEPGNATARRLLEQINTDPRVLLGARSRSYTVQAGDTMSGLAERYLGDPLLFYALARYNSVAPQDMRSGQRLQLPVRRAAVASSTRRPSTAPAPIAPGDATPAPVLSPAPAASADASARANQLRLRGLERLNAGDAAGAVNMLQQAATLDAANPAIQRDLARAERIQASVQ